MKKIFTTVCVMGALLMGTMSANAATSFSKTWSETGLNSFKDTAFLGVGNNFNLMITPLTAGEKMSYNSDDKVLETAEWKKGDRNYTISWQGNEGLTLKISKLEMVVRSKGLSSDLDKKYAYVTLGTNSAVDVLHYDLSTLKYTTVTNIKDVDFAGSSMNMNLNRTGNLSEANPFMFKSIMVDYTLVANAPALSESTKSVEVQEELSLFDYFSAANGLTVKYFQVADGGDVELTKGTFTSNVAGEYKVYAYVAGLADNYDQSANSDTMTITVNRLANELTVRYGEEEATNDTLTIELVQDTTIQIAFEATNDDDDINVIQTEGEDYATYEPTDSTITTLTTEGIAFFRFYQEQTDVYEAAQAVIKVIVKASPATSLFDVKAVAVDVKKMLVNGRLVIVRDGKEFNAQGACVR